MIRGQWQSSKKLIALSVIMACGTIATKATSIAAISAADLFSRSDEVAMVQIVSGETEAYQYSVSDSTPWPVCKLKVVDAFKGGRSGDIIFLAPCAGMELDGRYILFLETANALSPKPGFGQSSYGVLVHPKRVVDAGYGSMHVEYTCVFDGHVPDDSCDYGVELNPAQILLPKSLQTFPKSPATAETNYKRWVRQKTFVALLHTFAGEDGNAKEKYTNTPPQAR
jgi:hypothetical protein